MIKPEIVDKILELKHEKGFNPKQIFYAITKEGKRISLPSIYKILAEKPAKAFRAQIAEVSVATAIEKKQLKAALHNFQSLSLAEKLQRLNQVNEAKLKLKKAIQSLDQANLSRPPLKDAIEPEDAKTRESAVAKLRQLEFLIKIFYQCVPKAELKKIGLGSKEQ